MSVHVLDAMSRGGFEEVVAVHHAPSGLRAFLALHDTRLGPAFGGVRRWEYPDENRALLDCLRLARAMTYKCAWAGLRAGGGKLVILDRGGLDIERAYEHVGTVVERLGGRFYTGPDIGTGDEELGWIQRRTSHVTRPGPDGPGDLSAATSAGVFAGIGAALRHLDGEEAWERRTVVVQGLGGVGAGLARRLTERGARVVASEIDRRRAEEVAAELPVELLEPGTEVAVEADVFSPCAFGGILHDVTLERLHCRIVAGGANNVLARPLHGDRLHARGVLYVPDMVLTMGALIRGATFHLNGEPESIDRIEERVGEAVSEVLTLSSAEDVPPARVAEREAERRIQQAC